MKFKLEISPDEFSNKINHQKKVIFIGSCFSENIGQRLNDLKIPCIINPFGILYNPESVKQALLDIINFRKFCADDLYLHKQLYVSFSHHGSFSGIDKSAVLAKINKNVAKAHNFLKQTDVLYITFGTFRAYKLLQNNKIVANCHKLPNYEFENFLLNIDEIFSDYTKLIDTLRNFNPQLEIVFTVSPVRHWKDGATQNQISKSYLFVLIDRLLQKYKHLHYFPSYEIMMDDLRDYRFYADDLLHPSSLAVDYIWQKFEDTFFSQQTKEIAKKIRKIQKNLNHRPLYPNTEEYKKFIEQNNKQIKQLEEMVGFPIFDNQSDSITNYE